ncbi:MAG: right-handed parallel beta-helix repeat-containing protein [Tannerella sp.]|nr:right-handed parallel beta-helix repeat-containing protein [Tannerella sp.]
MKKLSLSHFVACAILVCLGMTAKAQGNRISVADFGLKPDTRENAVPYVIKALEACKKSSDITLVFPKGRYDFWPHHCIEREYFESNTTDINPKRLAVLIDFFDGLTIDGEGSDFVFHDRMQPFTIDNSKNVVIRNLTIDWDIPLTAQAVVKAATEQYIDLEINYFESPYIIENGKLVFVGEGWKSAWGGTMEFDKDTRNVVPQTGDPGCLRPHGDYRAEELAKGLVRINFPYTRKPAVGNLLVLRHSERDHAGVFIIDSKDIRLENIDMYHNAGLGVLSQYSENLVFTNVKCIPNEAKGRILAGHDDGFHYSNCKGDVVVDKCVFHALMDDPINVHGTSVRIIERFDDRTLVCKFMHNQSVGMTWAQRGDKVGFIDNKTLQTIAEGTVEKYRKIDNENFEVTFRQPVPKAIVEGNALENLTWTCNVSITDSYFKSCRARGVLISTPGKVVISGNTFESSGSAILIAGDANQWYESGAVKDVLITRNIFNDPCMTSMYQFCEGIISIFPEIPSKNAKTPPFHRNIVIRDNEFHPFDYPVLYAFSVDGLEFSGNKIIRSNRYEPFHPRKFGLTFEGCRRVTVKDNKAEGDVLGKNIRLVNTPKRECTVEKGDIFKITATN